MPVIKTPIIEGIKNEFNQYCPELIINNLPMIDGLLLSHKKILWGLYKNRITSNKPYIKSLKAIGYITNYYVFGDSPLYSTMTNMANNYMNIPLLDGKGSWGNKLKADGFPAHQRYTDCRLAEFGEYMLKGVENNAVKMKPNYDNSDIEPIVLPSIAPNIFLNVSQSISVSESSKIPSFNATETCDAIINYIKTKDIDSTKEILKCPDFQTSGGKILYNKDTIDKIYKTGRGSFTLIGKYNFNPKKSIFSIYEIPYETTVEAIEKKIIEGWEKGIFKEILDIRNASGKDGIRLDVYLKKNTNLDVFEQKLMDYTPYKCNFPCNFTVLDLDFKTPKLMSLEDVIEKWIFHRINCIINETVYDISNKKVELHKLYGLQIINQDLDIAISIIRKSKSEQKATEELINYFKLTNEQASYIATIRLLNINEEWIFKKIKNISDLENEIQQLEAFKDNKNDIHKMIITQLEEVKKKYGKERATEIIYEHEITQIDSQELVPDYSTTIVFTKEQYIKKTLRYAEKERQKVKDGDEVSSIIQTTNRGECILISDKGNAYKLKINELEERQPSQIGLFIPSLLQLEKNEKIIGMLSTNYQTPQHAIIVYESGSAVKIPLSSYETKQNRGKLANSLSLESPVITIFQIDNDTDFYVESNQGKAIVFNTSMLNEKKSRNSVGQTIMRSAKEGFKITKAELFNEQVDKNKYLVTSTSAGKLL